jgi:NADH:ubiquinone oxidoreductase subunit 2 (subunit N)
VSELLDDVSELLRGHSSIMQDVVKVIAGIALLMSGAFFLAGVIASVQGVSLLRGSKGSFDDKDGWITVVSLLIFCVASYFFRVAMKAFLFHCLTVLYYLAGTAFYVCAGGTILWWLYLIWTSIVSFLTAPIGIKSDSSPDDGLKWVLVLSTLGAYILWKIIKHVRINVKPSLLPTTGVAAPPLPRQ